MSRIEVGTEIRFFQWDTDHHNVFRALVRDWTGNKTAHPTVDLSFYDGTPTNLPNIRNEEFFATQGDLDGENYWKHAFRVRGPGDSRPFSNAPDPDVGDVVWYFRYDATADEHFDHPAIVRSVGGGAPPHNVSLFYIVTATGARQNVNAVAPFAGETFPTTNDYWAKRTIHQG